MNLIGLDLDGTLEDSRRDMISAVHRVRAQFGLLQQTDEEIGPWVNQGMDTLYRNCFKDYLRTGVATERLGEIQQAYEADYLSNVACETRLYPEIDGVLAELSELGRLAVITNKPERISRHLLKRLEADHWIDAVVGGDTCGVIKPDPLMLRTAAGRCGHNPLTGRSFMIGDTAGDIKMGRAYGAVTIWCAWGYSRTPGEEPDFIARTPKDLPGLIQKGFLMPLKPSKGEIH